jgi:restriction system protein
MSRRGSFLVAMQRIARERARQHRQAELAKQRHAREQVRLQREQLRLRAQLSKQQRQQYLESRATEGEEMTADVEATMAALRGVLESGLGVDPTVSLNALRLDENLPEFVPPRNLAAPQLPPKLEDFTRQVKPRTFLEKLFRGKRYDRDFREAQSRFAAALSKSVTEEADRIKLLTSLKADHDSGNRQKLIGIQEHNAEVAQLAKSYDAGDTTEVIAYCTMVLERSRYPDDFPREFRVAYASGARELVIDYELPTAGIVPPIAEYRHVKSKDIIEEQPRKASEIKETYRDLIAAISLRTIYELFRADTCAHLDVIVFSGFVRTVDPATGQNIRPYLISVRTTKERFREIDLHRVEMKACLRNLGAQLSPQPAELQPVKPLVEFDMVDRRFVEGADVLAELESRPNLMDLTPFEFEQLVGNLFAHMGLESKQTRSSRDGGVDVVAYDTRPVIGGKVVIQAKRYRHTVGVSAVRDLFGTMNHEGANKGILVSTSGYGPDAYDFIRGKPIELIDGGGLLYYLEQHAGVKARIIFPVEA